MMLRLLVLLGALIYSVVLIGQRAEPQHFTVKDGLPSTTTYSFAVDEKGFIWIGTEAGLVRFDGLQFKVYTTHDGLPDNEVLSLMFDSLTYRLWIITFSNKACYYFDGKFYNGLTDSSLSPVRAEKGEILNGNLQTRLGVFLYSQYFIYRCAAGRIDRIAVPVGGIKVVHQEPDSSLDMLMTVRGLGNEKRGSFSYYSPIDSNFSTGKWESGLFFLYRLGSVDVMRKEKGAYQKIASIATPHGKSVTNVISTGRGYMVSILNEGVFWLDSSLRQPLVPVWRGHANNIYLDASANMWIATSNDGVYVLRPTDIENYNLGMVSAVAVYRDGRVALGGEDGRLRIMSRHRLSDSMPDMGAAQKDGLVRSIMWSGDDLLYICSAPVWYHTTLRRYSLLNFRSSAPKCMISMDGGREIWIGLAASITKFFPSSGTHQEMAVDKRVFAMARHPDGRVFVGGIDGVYIFNGTRLIPAENAVAISGQRITSICFTPDSLMWVSTPSDGICAFDQHGMVGHISTLLYRAYHGAICRRIVADREPGILWTATNGGANRIRYHYRDTIMVEGITPLGLSDGLGSDDVYDIGISDSFVYMGTSVGLSILNKKILSASQHCPVYILSITIDGIDSAIHTAPYVLSHLQNNLKIAYAGVCLPSGADLQYQYRLLGSGNDEWTTTLDRSVDFRSLAPGTYRFEVAAIDKFGNRSPYIAKVSFRIRSAFYTTWWFYLIVMITILVIGFLIIRDRFRRQQERFEKEQSLHNKIIELEQQALKAQMNPHFIFNCLTAVQHFVNSEDMYSANMYLSNFARLIRKTLDLSGEQYISFGEEIAYLRDYIQMECLRFGDKFTWQIDVAEDLDTFDIQVPPMLLQPIIENAIRHGLRNLEDKAGLLLISFTVRDNTLYCSVDDNGIGRAKARELKTTMHVEYQSKGMSLTEMRIQAINQISDKKIRMDVKDKYDDNNHPDGTLFILTIEL